MIHVLYCSLGVCVGADDCFLQGCCIREWWTALPVSIDSLHVCQPLHLSTVEVRQTPTDIHTFVCGFNGLYQHISFVFLSFCFYQRIILRQMKERRWCWTVSCLGTLLSLDRPSTITPGILMKRMYMHTDTHTHLNAFAGFKSSWSHFE